MRKQWKQWQILFWGAPKSLQMVAAAMKLKDACSLEKKGMTNLDIILKSRDITLPTKVHLAKAMVFSRSHVWVWELDYKESWVPKNWCFWTVVLEKALGSPLDSKEIPPVHPEDQSWIFVERTDVEAETPVLWPPDVKNWLLVNTLMLGKIEGRRRSGWQDEMVGWHHQLNGLEFE